MAVLQRFEDGRYAWRCDRCGGRAVQMPHRGPRKQTCRRCQNVTAYRKKNPLVQRRTWETARCLGVGVLDL